MLCHTFVEKYIGKYELNTKGVLIIKPTEEGLFKIRFLDDSSKLFWCFVSEPTKKYRLYPMLEYRLKNHFAREALREGVNVDVFLET